MSPLPISGVGGVSGSVPVRPTAGNQTSVTAPGGNAFAKLIHSANQRAMQADQAVADLANGGQESLHDVVVSAAKADLSFRLVLEMRNRLTEAMQEIMRMQV